MTTPHKLTTATPQVREAKRLLRAVPPPPGYDWSSPPGRTFIAYVDGLLHNGFTAESLAPLLSLDPAQLASGVRRYRKGNSQ
jgi:hypothetical protein